ncbi:hypothetical protein BGX31_010746 [Mortierella sp. GBA43]|nr:hypothetical protein BGX31_010746 [Mortierella sp. GBA43]
MAKEALITTKVFLEDAVHLKDQPDRLGLVVRTWHDFESGESDSEDEDFIGRPELQHVVVHWADGSAPQMCHEDELVVADRSFSHGDVVKRSPNDIMSGTVVDVKVELDLEKICPPMTRFSGIDATHVDFVQQFVVNNHVIYDGWLGVKDEVTVLLSDSSVCVIKDSDDLDLRDQIHDQSCFFPDTLAPGHAVHGPSRVFKNAEYITGAYKPGQRQGYVLRTEVVSITVNWLSFNPLSLDQTPGVATPPTILDDFENIIVYKSVEQHCTYELQDRVKIVDRDMLSVVGTKTRVTVQWQDLSVTENEVSTNLVPYLNMDDQDVWPSDYVLLKPGEVLMDQPGGVNFDKKKSDMLGIVQSVNARERTTFVKWFSEERDQGLEYESEEFSLYEIMSHPDLKFRMGDLVVVSREREQSPSSDIAPRAPSVDDILLLVGRGKEIFGELEQERKRGVNGRATSEPVDPRSIERRGALLLERYGVEGVEALDRYLSEANKLASKTLFWLVDRGNPLKAPVPEDVLAAMSEHEKDLETIRPQLKWIGQIWKVYQDRPSALIRFMDGTSEEIPVGRIMVIDDEDSEDEDEDVDEELQEYDFDGGESDGVSSVDSWETDSEEGGEASDAEAEEDKEEEDKANAAVEPLPVSDGVPEDIKPEEVQTPAPVPTEIQDPLPEPEDIQLHHRISQKSSGRTLEHKDWKSFAILEETPADHHFLNQGHDIPQSDKAWIKRIAKEHAILGSSLPEGIRVRAFGDRLDLIRVLIEGPDHTPYRNALFLFDFKLTSHFPSQPPIAYFHSWTGGVGHGNVCLSLLNTWHGKDQTETWTPSSSILQLLISIQGLVLVPEPYYNEAGFEKFVGTKEAARNSELYNEKVYLLSLKTIQTILNHPPAPFQKEVRHFYFGQGKLEQTVIEGLELVARSEAAVEAGLEDDKDHDSSTSIEGGDEASPRSGLKRISKGALKMLKKHIDTLSVSLEE